MTGVGGTWRLIVLGLGLSMLGACSSESYLEDADREVYAIIRDKQQAVLGEAEEFRIDPGERVEEIEKSARETYREGTGGAGAEGGGEASVPSPEARDEITRLKEILHREDLPLGPEAAPVKIDLDTALHIAFAINRDIRSRKEDLYLKALDLTLQRYLWTPILSAVVSGALTRSQMDERYMSADADFSMSQLLASGAEVTTSIATDLLKIYSPNQDKSSSSLFSFNFLQPLWRGAGSLVARENLTQAERNVAYEVRNFERFKRSLAVKIASQYYQVLEQRDRVKNEYLNYQNLQKNVERSALMAESGRLPPFQVDQARQDELSAKNRWIRAQEQYEQALDSFKVTLGIPTEMALELDPRDLQNLTARGLAHPEIDLDPCIRHALGFRLDLLNERDALEDARRRVLVAKDGLGPDLDFTFKYSVGTEANKPLKFETDHPTYSAGLDLGLPLDRRSERNAFRQSLITLEREKRTLALLEDTIKQDVRQSYRSLQQARESYEIQKAALDLAKRRVESTNILVQAGRADQRDLLESQEALVSAQNALTAAVVEHTIAKMNFYLDIEFLRVTREGGVSSLQGENPVNPKARSNGNRTHGKNEDETPAETGE